MEDNELVRLRKEVARLTQVLDIVLLRNTQLEQQLSASQQEASSSTTSKTSIHKTYNGVTNDNNSNENLHTGVDDPDNSHDNFVNGVMNSGYAGDKNVNGGSRSNNVNDENVNGGNVVRTADSQNNNGGKQVLASNSASAPAEVINKTALLQANLRKLMPKSGRRSIRNTAAILLLLKQSPKQKVKDLQKLTGMSEDGMTKRIMSLKKYGLVTRVRGTGLVLTPTALEAIGDE